MRILIASPHLDDEVLGCASMLDGAHVAYTTRTHPEFRDVYEEHLAFRAEVNGVSLFPDDFDGLHFDRINELDQLGQSVLIAYFERVVRHVMPDLVAVPAPSYNQDHRAVYDAMLTACRPHDRNWFVKKVVVYEEPETFGALRMPPFWPTYFRPLDVDRKLALYHLYASQVRGHRSDEHIRAIAAVRGMQVNVPYAEGFEVLRWVE